MGTKQYFSSGVYTLTLDWNEAIENDQEWSYAPTITATSSGNYGDPSVMFDWFIEVDGVRTEHGENLQTSYYKSGTGVGPVQIDSYSRRTIERYFGQTRRVRVYNKFKDFYGASGKVAVTDGYMDVPARPWELPAPPSGLFATRVNDSNIALLWTDNPIASAPYDSILVERDSGSGFTQIASLPGTSTSFSDTSVAIDGAYRYRLRASNSSGAGSYGTESSTVHTTPAAPGQPVASKINTNEVQLDFSNTSRTATSLEVQRSQDGGATWPDSWTAAGLLTLWVDDDTPEASVCYRVRNVVAGLASAWSQASNTITVLAPPAPPTILTPANQAGARGESVLLSWRHNPNDGSAQTTYQLAVGTDPSSLVTGSSVTSGTESSTLPIPAADYAIGDTIYWKVRTWGLHADPSDWSSLGSIKVVSPVSVELTAPVSPYTLEFLPLALAWVYTDGSHIQSSVTATITDDGGAVVASKTIYGTGSSMVLEEWQPDNGNDYTLTLTAKSSSTLTATDTCAIEVDYNAPAIPSGSIAEVGCKALAITVHAGEATGSELPTDSLAIYRIDDGTPVLLADGLADGATVIDYTPRMDIDLTYRVQALSSQGLFSNRDLPYHLDSEGWFVWNYGQGDTQTVALKYGQPSPAPSTAYDDDSEFWIGAGAKDPTLLIGSLAGKTITVTAAAAMEDCKTWDAFADAWHGPCRLRCPGGTLDKVKPTITINQPHEKWANVTVTSRRIV